MKTRIGIALTALALASGVVYAANSSGIANCDRDGFMSKGGKHGSMQGQMYGREQGKGMHNAEQMQEHRLDAMEQRLGLTETQRQQVGALMERNPQQMSEKHAQMQAFRSQVHSLDPAAADYQDQVAALAKQKTEQMSQQIMERARLHAEIYALLTPEQQQAFRQMEPRGGDRQGQHHRAW